MAGSGIFSDSVGVLTVQRVMQLARLASEKQKSFSMRYVAFDVTLVMEIEHALESWCHLSSPAMASSLGLDYNSEEYIQQDQDRMHCSEAWRLGLLLYIYRVFWWEPGSSISILYSLPSPVDRGPYRCVP